MNKPKTKRGVDDEIVAVPGSLEDTIKNIPRNSGGNGRTRGTRRHSAGGGGVNEI